MECQEKLTNALAWRMECWEEITNAFAWRMECWEIGTDVNHEFVVGHSCKGVEILGCRKEKACVQKEVATLFRKMAKEIPKNHKIFMGFFHFLKFFFYKVAKFRPQKRKTENTYMLQHVATLWGQKSLKSPYLNNKFQHVAKIWINLKFVEQL